MQQPAWACADCDMQPAGTCASHSWLGLNAAPLLGFPASDAHLCNALDESDLLHMHAYSPKPLMRGPASRAYLQPEALDKRYCFRCMPVAQSP
jgi:hypothetical protein